MQALDEDLHTDPAQALPELADPLQQMLGDSGYALDDPVAREGEDREVVAEYLAARETADRLERNDTVDPGDIGAAITGLRALFSHIVEERSAH